MSHPAVTAGRPLVFAHRGGSALAPENTIPAFDRGLALGADGLELDVHLSRDGLAVVHHDPRLGRTTDATGRVAERTAAELATVDAGYAFTAGGGHPWRGRGIGVPMLRDVLRRYRDVRVIIEMKADEEALARAVVADVRAADAVERVCLGSFGRRVLRAARALDPAIATSAAREEVRWVLYRSWVGLAPRRLPNQAFQVPERAGGTRVVSPRFIRAAHDAGAVVQVWTVDREDDMRRLLDWGVDAIITDRPDVAVPVVHDWVERVGTSSVG
ncbi:MAG: glycerophosphodiester phosphodiesterase [Acidobacteriota bacterium]|nr:glycerophosphodiester phosphodiesterase [Acidobacteriota bacterium]